MAFQYVSLQKLLKALYANPALRKRMLREDFRAELAKEAGSHSSNGGDFHVPFWADAKRHAEGKLDLKAETDIRIAKNARRSRLYPLQRDGFLKWWESERRRHNEPFRTIRDHVIGSLTVTGLGTIRVDNNLAFEIAGKARRIVHPYFAEEPAVSKEAARLGLWVMSKSLPHFEATEMRLLDVIRGRAFSISELGLAGDEESRLKSAYEGLLREWTELRREYDKPSAA